MVSTKGRYALRVMIDLAQHAQEECISLRDIANRQQISVKYLEAVIAILNRAGMVKSRMGKNGGYQLSKSPGEYFIGEILRVTEGAIVPVSCLEGAVNTCERAAQCITLPMWTELGLLISDYLNHLTLEDLICGNVRRRLPVSKGYSGNREGTR